MLTRLVTPPAEEPVTLAEAKAHLRLEHDLDDSYVSTLITAARQYVEEYLWRAVLTQTWELVMDGFPVGVDWIELPKGELQDVDSVDYLDSEGVAQDWADYDIDFASIPGRIRLIFGGSWPSGVRSAWNSVVIRYVVGWEAPEDVPAPIKQAILLLVSQLYENRTPEVTGVTVSAIAFSAKALLAPYRIARFA